MIITTIREKMGPFSFKNLLTFEIDSFDNLFSLFQTVVLYKYIYKQAT